MEQEAKLSLRSFVIVSGWSGVLGIIAYSVYKFPELARDAFSTILGVGLTIVNIAIAKWLFEQK